MGTRQLNIRLPDETHQAAQIRADEQLLTLQDYVADLIVVDVNNVRAETQAWLDGYLAENPWVVGL